MAEMALADIDTTDAPSDVGLFCVAVWWALSGDATGHMAVAELYTWCLRNTGCCMAGHRVGFAIGEKPNAATNI